MMYNLTVERPYSHLIHIWKELLDSVGEVEKGSFHIREALAGDVFLLDVREEQKDTFGGMNADKAIRMHAWLNILSPMHYSVFHDTNLLMMISIIPVADGVGEISFLTDNNFVNASRLVKVHMIKAFKEAVDLLPFRRLQAKVKEGFDIGTNFVERMGFEKEGLLKKYGPDEDNYWMYGKTR